MRWVFPIAAVIMVIGVDRLELAEPAGHDRARTRRRSSASHGVPVNAGGSVVVARWAMSIFILVIGIAFGSLLLSYFYLRLQNPHGRCRASPTRRWDGPVSPPAS